MTYNNLRYTVVNRIDLGRTRIAGYTLFNPKNCSFQETPPSLTKQLVEMGQVNGLIIENDEIALDPDFCQYNLIIKSGVGNYRLLNENRDQPEDLMLSVTKAITDPETHENVYEVVTNKCARVCIHEWALKVLPGGAIYTLDTADSKTKILQNFNKSAAQFDSDPLPVEKPTKSVALFYTLSY